MASPEHIRHKLAAHVGKPVKLHLTEGEPFVTTLRTVDDDGFLHEMEETSQKEPYWTRFEDVVSVEPIPPAREP